MKNSVFIIWMFIFSFGFQSCRETTEDRVDDTVEMGDDINSRETRLETEDELIDHTESRVEEAEEREDTIN